MGTLQTLILPDSNSQKTSLYLHNFIAFEHYELTFAVTLDAIQCVHALYIISPNSKPKSKLFAAYILLLSPHTLVK